MQQLEIKIADQADHAQGRICLALDFKAKQNFPVPAWSAGAAKAKKRGTISSPPVNNLNKQHEHLFFSSVKYNNH